MGKQWLWLLHTTCIWNVVKANCLMESGRLMKGLSSAFMSLDRSLQFKCLAMIQETEYTQGMKDFATALKSTPVAVDHHHVLPLSAPATQMPPAIEVQQGQQQT
jgi:hypothetical protein